MYRPLGGRGGRARASLTLAESVEALSGAPGVPTGRPSRARPGAGGSRAPTSSGGGDRRPSRAGPIPAPHRAPQSPRSGRSGRGGAEPYAGRGGLRGRSEGCSTPANRGYGRNASARCCGSTDSVYTLRRAWSTLPPTTGVTQGVTAGVTRRVTLREAARVLGISKEAVRKRVKRETLAYEKKDGVVYVFLPNGNVYLPGGGDAGTDAGGDGGSDNGGDESVDPYGGRTAGDRADHRNGHDHRDDLLEELRDRVRALEEANRENRRIILALTSRLPALEAPRDAPETDAETVGGGEDRPVRSEAHEGVQDARRPWWIRIFVGG